MPRPPLPAPVRDPRQLGPLLACLFVALSGPGCGDEGGGESDDDLAYDQLAGQLDARRSRFLEKSASAIDAAGGHLYWMEFPGFAPTLHSYEGKSGKRIDYTFSIGSDRHNYQASDDLIVSAERSGDNLLYRAYAASDPARPVDTLLTSAPPEGQRFWLYSVDGGSVYYLLTDKKVGLYRWTPGSPATMLLGLDEVGIPSVAIGDLQVRGSAAVVVSGGRIFHLDLVTRKATWLKNKTDVTGAISFDRDGVLFLSAGGPFYYRLGSGVLLDMDMMIRSSSYKLNDTYPTVHLYEGEGALFRGRMIYTGQGGLFSYDINLGTVQPILLYPRADVHVNYQTPEVLESGALFVVGETDTQGPLGPEGPVFRVDLAP